MICQPSAVSKLIAIPRTADDSPGHRDRHGPHSLEEILRDPRSPVGHPRPGPVRRALHHAIRTGDVRRLDAAIGRLDAEVPPTHLVGAFVVSNAVNLKADHASQGHAVPQVDAGDVVDPRPDPVALALDAVLVPLAILEGLACGGSDVVLASMTARRASS